MSLMWNGGFNNNQGVKDHGDVHADHFIIIIIIIIIIGNHGLSGIQGQIHPGVKEQ